MGMMPFERPGFKNEKVLLVSLKRSIKWYCYSQKSCIRILGRSFMGAPLRRYL